MNWEFFFFQVSCLNKVKEPSLPFCLSIAGEWRDGFISFPKRITTIWNGNCLIEDLNSSWSVYFFSQSLLWHKCLYIYIYIYKSATKIGHCCSNIYSCRGNIRDMFCCMRERERERERFNIFNLSVITAVRNKTGSYFLERIWNYVLIQNHFMKNISRSYIFHFLSLSLSHTRIYTLGWVKSFASFSAISASVHKAKLMEVLAIYEGICTWLLFTYFK